MNQEEKHNNSWIWVVVILGAFGLFYVIYSNNQWHQYQQASKIIEAQKNCRQYGRDQGWDSQAIATCKKLGTEGYTDMVNYYYNMY